MQCSRCGKDNFPDVSFCIECGLQLRGERIDYNDLNKKYFTQSIVLIVCIVLIILSSFRIVNSLPFLVHEYLYNGLLVLTTLVFVILDFNEFAKLFRFSPRLIPLLQILFGAPLLALLVIYIARYLNYAIGIETHSYYENYLLNTSNMYFYGILFVAFLPGFIEEFLFRGILFNHLLKLTKPKATILISGILFSFIHFSIFSLVWLTAIGLFLGYLRLRYRTIWYGIFFHVLYNASIFFIEIYMNSQ